MDVEVLQKAIADLPPGPWAVGVSGGADSVALLLLLLRDRPDLVLHVVHLDHETRGGQSAVDAAFVAELAGKMWLPCTVEKRSAVESAMDRPVKNISDRYRRARFALFGRVVAEKHLQGVVLAHHAGDQAETVLMRLLRGAGPENLAGIRGMSLVNGLPIARPLLGVFPELLRQFLRCRGQDWREDSSNESDDYQRNRLRHWLAGRPALRGDLLRLESASRGLRDWLDKTAPVLGESFPTNQLSDLPLPLARHAAGRWLVGRGAPPADLSGRTCERLIEMCADAASPPRQCFPGGLQARRKRGEVFMGADFCPKDGKTVGPADRR